MSIISLYWSTMHPATKGTTVHNSAHHYQHKTQYLANLYWLPFCARCGPVCRFSLVPATHWYVLKTISKHMPILTSFEQNNVSSFCHILSYNHNRLIACWLPVPVSLNFFGIVFGDLKTVNIYYSDSEDGDISGLDYYVLDNFEGIWKVNHLINLMSLVQNLRDFTTTCDK